MLLNISRLISKTVSFGACVEEENLFPSSSDTGGSDSYKFSEKHSWSYLVWLEQDVTPKDNIVDELLVFTVLRFMRQSVVRPFF